MKITEEKRDEIISVYRSGKTQLETAKLCGVCPLTAWKYINEAGLGPGIGGKQEGRKKISDDQLREACTIMSRMEIAEKYGMHPASLDRRMRQIDCYALKTRLDGSSVYSSQARAYEEKAHEWHYAESTAKWVNDKQAGFEYVASKGRAIKIRCRCCGEETEKDVANVRKRKATCKNCKQLLQERKQLLGALSRIVEIKTPKICEVCGKEFFSPYPEQKYCSQRCKKKNKTNTIRRRCRNYGVKYISGITLPKVYERDGGICQICGKPTDWHDRSWTEFLGPMHPTIDHKKALANGGGHTWDNVQLAHAICNSYKRDLEVS